MKQRLENEQFNFLGLVVGHLFLSGRSRIRLYVGQLVVKLLLIKFASHKRIDDGLWRLGTWWKLATGNLRRTKPLLSKRNDSLPPSQEHLVVEWP